MRYGRFITDNKDNPAIPEVGFFIFQDQTDGCWYQVDTEGNVEPFQAGGMILEFDIDQDTTEVTIPDYAFAVGAAIRIDDAWTGGESNISVNDKTDSFALLTAVNVDEPKYVASNGYDSAPTEQDISSGNDYLVNITGAATGTAKLFLNIVQYPTPPAE